MSSPDVSKLSIEDPEDEARAAAAAFGDAESSAPPRAQGPDLSSDSYEEAEFHDAPEHFDTAAATAAAVEAAAAAAGNDGEGLQDAEDGVELLIVFVHGFRGSAENTFGPLPDRVQAVLQATYPRLARVESIVYPTYDTRGKLSDAVDAFSDWLAHLVIQREVGSGGRGKGSVRVILCGHSMGGLVVTDAGRTLLADAAASALPGKPTPELWPRVHAVLAFDTPYFGVHPHVFRNAIGSTLDTANQYVSTARDVGSAIGNAFGWSTESSARGVSATSGGGGYLWAAAGAATMAVAGFGLASNAWGARPRTLEESYTWVADHLAFVGTLWDSAGHTQRIRQLDALVRTHNVFFRCWYTLIPPPLAPAGQEARTFIILPPSNTTLDHAFVPAVNTRATDEISAHKGMFKPAENSGYYALGADVARVAAAAFAAELKNRDQSRTARATPSCPPAAASGPQSTPCAQSSTPSTSAPPLKSAAGNRTNAPAQPMESAAPAAKPTPVVSTPSFTQNPADREEKGGPASEFVTAVPPGSRWGSAGITAEQEAQKQEIATAAAAAAEEAERKQQQAELEEATRTRPAGNAAAKAPSTDPAIATVTAHTAPTASGPADSEAQSLWETPTVSLDPAGGHPVSHSPALWPPDEPSPWA